jgi:hypothetical protein
VPGRIEPPPVETGPRLVMRQVLRRSALATLCWRRIKLLAAEQRSALSRRFNATLAQSTRAAAPAAEDPRLPAILDTLNARAERVAPQVLYLYIPHLEYFLPGCPESRPETRRLLAAFAARNHVRIVDTADAMRAEFERTGQPMHGFANSVIGSGHINSAGHRVVGGVLARVLAEDFR